MPTTFPTRPALLLLTVLSVLLSPLGTRDARANDQDAIEATIYLMSQAVEVRRDGRHHRLLRALRHLQDPELTPLFESLSQSNAMTLKTHGLLGLAEASPSKHLDITLLLEVDQPVLQAELISTALDQDLISLDDCETMLNWKDLDPGVELVIMTRLLEAGRFNNVARVKELINDENIGRRATAAAILCQLGDPLGHATLSEISESDDPIRDRVEQTILRMCLRHDFDRMGPWAYELASKPNIEFKRQISAIRVALRFGVPNAIELWQQMYNQADSVVAKTQLSMSALQMSPYVDARLFDTLIQSDSELIQKAGEAGQAIAQGSPALQERVYELVQMRHGLTNRWAIHYALNDAQQADGQVILLGVIVAYLESEEDVDRTDRLDESVQATQALFEIDPTSAGLMLRPYLAEGNDPLLSQAILLGLVRTQSPEAAEVIRDLPLLADRDAASLQVLLMAKNNIELSAREARMLRTIVRGGGSLQDTLRIQAAWAYLKRMGRADEALSSVIGQ